jgi:thiol-disulfide isomerase/thioredoxin
MFANRCRDATKHGIAAIAAAIACSASPAAGQADLSEAYPKNSVLLLVASWCAPCHAELAVLDDIARAAGPFEVRVMLVDDSRNSHRMVARVPPHRRWIPEPAVMTAARKDLLARTPGLPFAVAIGPDGRPCAAHRGGLNAARAKALVNRCDRPQ